MKKFRIILAVLIAMSITTNAQWNQQTSGTANDLKSVFFINTNTGYAAGVNGTILKTINGGTDWIAQTSGTANYLNSVFFIDANNGYAVGAGGTILKTTNSGVNWISQTSGTTEPLSCVVFTDANTGFVASNKGILKTTNGGIAWAQSNAGISNYSINSLFFLDANTGYAVGYDWNNAINVIIKTTNGGTDWTAQTSGTTNFLNSVFFIDTNTGYVVGEPTIILKTINGGASWIPQTSVTTENLKSVYFTDANTGYIAGNSGIIQKTTNGGANWSSQAGAGGFIFSVFFADANVGYAVGGYGTIIKTTNGGGGESINYSNATLNGPWFFYQEPLSPYNDSLLYMVFDGNGNIIDMSGFGGPVGGNYNVTSDGSFSGNLVMGVDNYPLLGQLTSPDNGTGFAAGSNWIISRISNPGALSDQLIGTLFTQDCGQKEVIISVNSQGEVISATGLIPPVSGRVYADLGVYIGHLRTGEDSNAKWNEFSIMGYFANDSLNGRIALDGPCSNTGSQLIRKGTTPANIFGFEQWNNMGSYMDPQGFATPNLLVTGAFYPVTRSTDHYPVSVGNYSIRIESNISLMPAIDAFGLALQNTSNNILDGPSPSFPITGHPTSLTGYYKYAPQNGDTMRIQIVLYSNGEGVTYNELLSTATVSDWTSFNLPLPAYTFADSATIILASYNCNGPYPAYSPHGNSVLYVDNLNFDYPITREDNFGFEKWKDMGSYMEPESFLTLNSNASGSFYPVKRSTDHYPVSVGQYSIRIESNPSLLPGSDALGLVLQNSGNTLLEGPGPSFAITGHPTSLTGYYKYAPQNSDTMRIQIQLYQNGSGVSYNVFLSTVSVSSWTSFTIPLPPYTSADSGSIMLAAYNANGPPSEYIPYGNSVLYIDNLNFDNLITGSVSQWTQLTSGTTNNLMGVSFVNQNLGYVCGDNGTILKTIDGGINWVPQNSGVTYQLTHMQFLDANNGYAASYSFPGGKLLKTVNGGSTWNDISINRPDARVAGWWFFAADTGFIAIGDANYSNVRILKTVNGGNSWDTIYFGGNEWISDFSFPDRNNGYATMSSSKILKTSDGGNNWTVLNNIGGELWMSGIHFFNKDIGIVGGGDYYTNGGSIFKTTDGGTTWQTLSNEYGPSFMQFTTLSTGYAVAQNANWSFKKIIKTTDAGVNWTFDNTQIYGMNFIFFPDPDIGYAVGDYGTILKTTGCIPGAAGPITGQVNVCQGQTNVNYTIPAIPGVTSYVWNLPSGASGTSSTNSITVNYGTSAVSGNLSVKGTNSCGDGAISALAIIVNSIPATPTITINGDVLHSSATIGNQWYNQNGLISGAVNQDYKVTSNGNYYVIVNSLGCNSQPSNIIPKLFLCDAQFNYSGVSSVIFSDLSAGNPTAWSWDFGDGTYSTQQNPSHNYIKSGSYLVTLTIFNSVNNCVSSLTKKIIAGSVDCQADFDAVINSVNGITSFTSKSQNATDYYWDFGDGIYNTQANPEHTYTTAGIYKVCLTIWNSTSGCQSVSCKDIIYLPSGDYYIQADFSFYTNPDNLTVNLSDLSTSNTTDWYWTMGDGKVMKTQNPVYTYAKPGVYKVCLTAFDKVNALSQSVCKEIRVGEITCTVRSGFSYFINPASRDVAFINTAKGSITDYFWTFGDGLSSTGENPLHNYSSPGYYLVNLAVRNRISGCMDMVTQFIQVGSVECRSDFTYEVNPDNNSVNFKDKSKGMIDSYYWEFGDGSYSVLQNPSNLYKKPGMYIVGQTVIDNTNGCIDFSYQPVQVGEINCAADFVTYIDSLNYTGYFTNRVLGESTALLWSFGDGRFSTRENPIHIFPGTGIYSVGLNTFDFNSGCMDYYQEMILIGGLGNDCNADFVYILDPSNPEVKFSNKSIGDITGSIWNFGDGTDNSTDTDAVHTYTKGGYYNVCLTVTNSSGIKNMGCKWVLVEGSAANDCRANFMFNIDSINLKVTFVDNSFGEINKHTWDFGDSKTDSVSIEQNPVHIYDQKGYYLVQLKVENTVSGCISNEYKLLNVAESQVLKASFGYEAKDPDKKVAGYPVDLVSASSGDGATVEWDFGDKQVKKESFTVMDSTSRIVTHYYQKPGRYMVCIRISDPVSGQSDQYCSYVYTKNAVGVDEITETAINMSVYPNPFIDFTTINYALPKTQFIELVIFDQLGRRMETLVKERKDSGNHQIIWESKTLITGIYHLKLITADGIITKQLVITK